MKNTEFEKVQNICQKYVLIHINKKDLHSRLFVYDALIKSEPYYKNIISFVEYAEKNNFHFNAISSTLAHDLNGIAKGDKFFIPRVNEYKS